MAFPLLSNHHATPFPARPPPQLAKISGMDEFKGKPTPIKTLLEWVNAMFGGDSSEKTKYQVCAHVGN